MARDCGRRTIHVGDWCFQRANSFQEWREEAEALEEEAGELLDEPMVGAIAQAVQVAAALHPHEN